MKLLKLELGQDSGVNTSSPTIKKCWGFPLLSGPPFFTYHLKDEGEEIKKALSVEMQTRKHLGLVQLWAGKCPAGQIAGFPVSFFSHAPLTCWSLASYHIFMHLGFMLTFWWREFSGDWVVSENIALNVMENYVYVHCSRCSSPPPLMLPSPGTYREDGVISHSFDLLCIY